MAAYPRNNLNEQLSLKSKTGQANGTSNSGARTARQQAGLAREMSGVAQYPKAAFTFACEGSAKVQPGNKKQPISVESSSSTLSRSTSSSSGPSGVPGNRAASGQGLLQNKQANNTSALKGKGRARRFEEIQEPSMLVDEHYDDSGFADVQPASKRPKGNSTVADQTLSATHQSRLSEKQTAYNHLEQMRQDALKRQDQATASVMVNAIDALRKEIEQIKLEMTKCAPSIPRQPAVITQAGQAALARSMMNGQKPSKASSTRESQDDYDDIDLTDADWEDMLPAKPVPKRKGREVLQVSSAARQPSTTHRAPPDGVPTMRAIPTPVSRAPVRTVAADPAEREQYPWSLDVRKSLSLRFGLENFRPNQLKAINATLAGKDVFVLMPTGGGKSICYQLPAVITTGVTRGVTVVVSPLISLIVDQVTALINKKITTVTLNSTMDAENRNFALAQLRAPEPTAKLVYVTPELISKSGAFRDTLQSLYARKRLARFVVDEAHCVSRWGHDLRPDYKELSWCKKTYPDIPLMALTATANERVKADVKDILGLGKDCVTLSQSFNRSNLFYEIRRKGPQALTDLAAFIMDEHKDECGIIYCLSRRSCEETADKLRDRFGLAASHYHAAMEKSDRQRVQLAWLKGDVKVICATIAFGMGIDKPDVRYVVHYNLPSSLEGYYQETGRAGRDGLPSTCVLYFSFSDIRTHQRFIDESQVSREQKQSQRDILSKVLNYCINTGDCRRTQVLQYFGEEFSPEQCKETCDNCRLNRNVVPEAVDITDKAMELISLVEEMQSESVTLAHAVDVYYGSKAKRVTSLGHEKLKYAGNGSTMKKLDVERLLMTLISKRLIIETEKKNKMGFTNSYLMVDRRNVNAFKGRLTMSMSRSAPTSKPKVSKTRQVIPLQVNKPVLSRAQTFEEDEDEDEAGDDAVEVDDDGDDDITISDRSHNEYSRSTRKAPSASKSRKRSGYGDETDEDFVDDTSEDEEPESSDEAFIAPSDEEEQADESELDNDDLEIVHNVVESDEADSDVELVPTRTTAKKPAIKTAKVSSKASRKPTALSTQARAIHDGQTTQIFFELQEVVEEAFKTQDADYDQSFDDILTCIAEARCQVSGPDSCFADFKKIPGWDEEMYDQFGVSFKTIISKAIKLERKMLDRAGVKSAAGSVIKPSAQAKSVSSKTKQRSASTSSSSTIKSTKKGGSTSISRYFENKVSASKAQAQPKKTKSTTSKKNTSAKAAVDLRERFSAKLNSSNGRSSKR